MKMITQVGKELKISSRGFYFYTELFLTLIILFIMLFIVPEEVLSEKEEYLFYNMKPEISQLIFDKSIEKGVMQKAEDKTFKLKPTTINVYPDRNTVPNQFDGIVMPLNDSLEKLNSVKNADGSYTFNFTDEIEVNGVGYAIYDGKDGPLDKHVYLFDNFAAVLRLSSQERNIGGIIYYDKNGREHYEMFLSGIVTEKFKNASYALHNDNIYDVIDDAEQQSVRHLGKIDQLNFKQSFIPLIIVYLNALMGIFIVAGHLFNDRAQDVISPARVSPISMNQILLAKLIASLPVSLVSALIICIPIMKFQPNYPLLILVVLATAFFAGSVGLLIASYFDSMKSSFGLMMIVLVALMLPILSYYLPTFSPSWLKLIPSHHILLSVKDAISKSADGIYALMTSAALLLVSIPIIALSAIRFKRAL